MADAEHERDDQRVQRPEIEHAPVRARQRRDEGERGGDRERDQQDAGRAERARAGEGVRDPAQQRQRGDRGERAGQRPDRDQARGGDGRELLALHLADEQALAGGGDGRDDHDPDQAGEDAGGDRAVPVGLVAQRSPAGRPGAVQRRRQQRRAERRQQRDRAVEAEREHEHLSGRARACRQQRVQEARAHDSSQRRCRDRAPEGRKLHGYAVSTGGAPVTIDNDRDRGAAPT